jgi:adenosylhomocysteine nucleosidase
MEHEKIGIIAAMRVEAEHLLDALNDRTDECVGSIRFSVGTIGGHDVVLAVCGVGKVFAAMCAQTMIVRYGVTMIWNTGAAGTLTEELSVGDYAVASDVVMHDMDTSPLGDPVGWISGLDRIRMETDPTLRDRFAAAVDAAGGRYRVGTIASGDTFVASADKKLALRERFGAVACEMEGAAIGQVCTANGVPFLVLRAISDGGDEDAAVDFPTFVTRAAARSSKIVLDVLNGAAGDAF